MSKTADSSITLILGCSDLMIRWLLLLNAFEGSGLASVDHEPKYLGFRTQQDQQLWIQVVPMPESL